MELTEELWEAFGFEKQFGWNRWGWTYKQDRNIQFFEGVSTHLGSTEPKTVEELLTKLHTHWKKTYHDQGKEEFQYRLRDLLGIE